MKVISFLILSLIFLVVASSPFQWGSYSLISSAHATVDISQIFTFGGRAIGSLFGNLGDFVTLLIRAVFAGVGLIFLAYFLLGGFKYITSAGDPKAAKAARDTLTNAALGLIIVIGSVFVVRIVQVITGVRIF
jgi:hypothetical protein